MVPRISLQEMMAVLEAKLSQLPGVLAKNLDLVEVEWALQETMAQLMARMLEPLFADMMQAAEGALPKNDILNAISFTPL
jgi:hypothetical protein